jgi:enoyl-[acyl-carrier protein] reductase I
VRSIQVETVRVHHLGPRRHEVLDELLLRVGAGITDARYMFAFQQKYSPLGRGVTLEELGGAGLYLLSDLSTGVTGEIHFVDSGYNVIAMPQPDALKAGGTAEGNGDA